MIKFKANRKRPEVLIEAGLDSDGDFQIHFDGVLVAVFSHTDGIFYFSRLDDEQVTALHKKGILTNDNELVRR
jgi:hypothetical protein